MLPYAGVAASKPQLEPPRLRTGEHARPMCVLFVDDEPVIRRGYERAFGKTTEVVLAVDGVQAWIILSGRHDFDVIVCDLLMPNVSGIALYDRVRGAYPSLADAFVFVTGGATDVSTQEFLGACANAVLSKPFEMHELVALVEARRPRRR